MTSLASLLARRCARFGLTALSLVGAVMVAPGVIPVQASGFSSSMDLPRQDAQLACGGGGGNSERKPARPGTKTHVHG